MAIPSSHKSLQRTVRQAEATQQLIAFRLRQEWFALPINAVQKVVPMGNVYGVGSTGVSLTLYQDKELLVVDVGDRIFSEAPNQGLSVSASISKATQHQKDFIVQYLLIVKNSQGELVGLSIDSPPKLLRVPESAFAPLSSAYISEANIQCVSSLMIQTLDEPPLFLLNPDQVLIVSNFIDK